jgi:calmodulin
MFDRNNDGVITAEELHTVMKSLGENPSESEVQEMIYEVDLEGKGSINFQEFLIMMAKKSELPLDEDEDIKAAFIVFDRNNDGFVTAEEMKEVLSKFDLSTSAEEIEDMIKSADVDGDGMLSFDEFSNLMKTTEALKLSEAAHKHEHEEEIDEIPDLEYDK